MGLDLKSFQGQNHGHLGVLLGEGFPGGGAYLVVPGHDQDAERPSALHWSSPVVWHLLPWDTVN